MKKLSECPLWDSSYSKLVSKFLEEKAIDITETNCDTLKNVLLKNSGLAEAYTERYVRPLVGVGGSKIDPLLSILPFTSENAVDSYVYIDVTPFAKIEKNILSDAIATKAKIHEAKLEQLLSTALQVRKVCANKNISSNMTFRKRYGVLLSSMIMSIYNKATTIASVEDEVRRLSFYVYAYAMVTLGITSDKVIIQQASAYADIKQAEGELHFNRTDEYTFAGLEAFVEFISKVFPQCGKVNLKSFVYSFTHMYGPVILATEFPPLVAMIAYDAKYGNFVNARSMKRFATEAKLLTSAVSGY